MSDENIAMIVLALEKACAARAKNKRPEINIREFESQIGATIPEWMRVPIMDLITDMAEDARRRARRHAELNERILKTRLAIEQRSAVKP
ncbi:MAG: hypothetical protein Q7S99_03085 [Parvibaculum sp.]|nr:hypothetical protein [Parvibaculum sp.]